MTMADSRRTNTEAERVALAEIAAREAAAFYHGLRKLKVPATAAQTMSEAYTASMVGRDDEPREPWMP